MKIALFVHCFYPLHYHGTEAYTLAVAKRLLLLGHQPIIVTATFAGEPSQQAFIERYSWEGVSVVSIDKNKLPPSTVRDTYAHQEMRAVHNHLLGELAPDVIHVCHLINHTAELLTAARQLGIPTLATLTDFFGICYTNRLQTASGRLCAGPSTDRANCIACYLHDSNGPNASWLTHVANLPFIRDVTAKVLARLGRWLGESFTIEGFKPHDMINRPSVLKGAMSAYQLAVAPTKFLKDAYQSNGFPSPIVISCFGIDIDRSPKPMRSQKDPLRLGFIGQLAPHKGLHLLVDALRALDPSQVSLKIWGDPQQDPSYVAMLQSLGAGLRMHFEGLFQTCDLPRVMNQLDFLVIPSTWYENSPLILLQALATHTPVIVSDVPGLVEFVETGRNGFSFRRSNVADLVRVLRNIVATPRTWESLNESTSYERTVDDMVADLIGFYEKITGSEGPSAVIPTNCKNAPQ